MASNHSYLPTCALNARDESNPLLVSHIINRAPQMTGWLHGTVDRTSVLAGELYLSYVRLTADG